MPNVADIVIIGGGGHARVLIDAIRASNDLREIVVLDADEGRAGTALMDAQIIGGDVLLEELARRGTRHFAVGVGGARNNGPRADLFERACGLGLVPLTILHPNAIVSRWTKVGQGCQILAGAIVNAGATLGKNVIVNTGAIVEHDCEIGDNVHIATGARLASTVKVGARAHIGAGAVVRQLITIGEHSVVGAGAVVVKNVASSAVVAGVPAKELSQ